MGGRSGTGDDVVLQGVERQLSPVSTSCVVLPLSFVRESERRKGCSRLARAPGVHTFVRPAGEFQDCAMWRPLLLLAALLTEGCAITYAREAAAPEASRRTAGGMSGSSTGRAGRRQLAAPAIAAGLPLPPDWRSEVTNDTQASVLKKAASPEGVVIFTTFALPGREEAGARPAAAMAGGGQRFCRRPAMAAGALSGACSAGRPTSHVACLKKCQSDLPAMYPSPLPIHWITDTAVT